MNIAKTLLCYSLIVCCSVTQVAIAKEEIAPKLPVETFFKFSEFDRMVLSPTGKYIAARLKMKGSKKLAIMETKTNKILSVSHFGDDKDVGSIGWLTDERAYAEMVTRVGPLLEPRRTGFLFAVNADGSKKRQLLPTPPRPGKAADRPRNFSLADRLPDDDKHVLAYISNSAFQTLYKLNIFTGKQIVYKKAHKSNASMELDHDNIVRFSIVGDYDVDEDISTRQVLYRDSHDDDWQLHETIIDKDTRKKGRSNFEILRFNKDNTEVLIHKNDEIVLYNPLTRVYKTVLKIEGDAEISSYINNHDYTSPELIGIKRMPGKIESTYFDYKNPEVKLRIGIAAAFPNSNVRLVNSTKNKETTLVKVVSDKNSGTYYLFDRKKNSLTYLLDTSPDRDEKLLTEMNPFSFIARDGLEIRGYLTLPKGKTKNLPLVQVVHGGPYGPFDKWRYDREAQFFANRGYAVMQVNFRGSGGRGDKFLYDSYKKMGKEMQHDLTDSVHWAIEQGIVDKDKICIYGASYGGYASLMGAVMEPDLYKCAVPYAGVYDIEIFRNNTDFRVRDSGKRFLEEAWNAYDEEFVKARSPIYHLDKLKAALLFVHGGMDKRVTINHYEAVAEKLDEMGYPYESIIEPDEAHGFREQENVYNLYRKVDKFLAKHLGGS
ncbi:prolyl oligopeptidase family serine peptidase [Thalassotalea fonticola]|uniref:Prolyl oligopeptidase family serine peptidase n=1 Tax=Thalassotalea fonticola TaxID=3065649 RepID=A0ABZ0GK34_9GAMM|nr:prolyl oligopeptidase family serine peptidase [Colwelliaceae bacterium S1-1]